MTEKTIGQGSGTTPVDTTKSTQMAMPTKLAAPAGAQAVAMTVQKPAEGQMQIVDLREVHDVVLDFDMSQAKASMTSDGSLKFDVGGGSVVLQGFTEEAQSDAADQITFADGSVINPAELLDVLQASIGDLTEIAPAAGEGAAGGANTGAGFQAYGQGELDVTDFLASFLDESQGLTTLEPLLEEGIAQPVATGGGGGGGGGGDPLSVSVANATVNEDAGTVRIAVTLSQPAPAGGVSVAFTTADGSAQSGLDYEALNGRVTFAAGETVAFIEIPITNDTIHEVSETFSINLSDPSTGLDIADGTGVVTIIDNDAPPPVLNISVNDVSVSEDAGMMTFTITLSSPAPEGGVSVDYTTANGTALAGADYNATSGTLTFAEGQTTLTVSIPVINDSIDEPNETLFLNLSNPTNGATITDGQGVGTIIDDDPSTVTPGVIVDNVTVNEADGTMTFTISLTSGNHNGVILDYATADGTALAGSDYLSTSGTLSFAPGQTTQTVTVTILDDAVMENTESFTLDLSNVVGGTLVDSQGVGTILDNDNTDPLTPVQVVINDVSVTEGGEAIFTVSLSRALVGNEQVVINWDTSDNTATAIADYLAANGQLVFNAGTGTTLQINVGTVDDSILENPEDFLVNLTTSTNNVTLSDAEGVGTIIDNDGPGGLPTITIADHVVIEEDGAVARIAVTLSEPAGPGGVSVDYTTADGTAVAGSDYTTTSGTVTFAEGQQVVYIEVPILNDNIAEDAEAFEVLLSNPVDATISDDTGLVSILDNDDPTPQTAITINDVTVNEGDGTITFTVRLSDPADANGVTVDFATRNGSAVAVADYASANGTVVFAEGQTEQTITLSITDDMVQENAENFFIDLTNPTGNAYIADAMGVGTIIDNDNTDPQTPVQVVINDVTVTEGGEAVFTVSLSRALVGNEQVTINWDTSDDTATAVADYLAANGQLVFNASTGTTLQINVGTVDDSILENPENFLVDLTTSTNNVTIADAQGVGTIIDNDGPSGLPVITIADHVVIEEDGAVARIAVTLSEPAGPGGVSVDYTTADGTAVAGSDYTTTSGTVTFAEGQQVVYIEVPILNDDIAEDAEAFEVLLSNPVDATIADDTGLVSILDNDDPTPQTAIVINDVTVNEDAGTITFTVRLSDPADADGVTVDFATRNGSAAAGADYTSANGTVVFAEGETVQTITLSITDDMIEEGAENFFVDLTNPTGNAYIADALGVGTILDNDGGGLPPLFTPDADYVDFNSNIKILASGAIVPIRNADGSFNFDPTTFYDGLESDDTVILAGSQAAADAAGYDTSRSFSAGAGNDIVQSLGLNDTIYGGEGSDRIFVDGADNAFGQGGNDDQIFFGMWQGFGGPDGVLRSMTDQNITFDNEGREFEHIYTGTGADIVFGSDNTTTFISFDPRFNEWIDTSGRSATADGYVNAELDQADIVDGGAGNDHIITGYGDDTIVGGAGADAIYAGEGNDLIITHDNLSANGDGVADFVVRGEAGDDYIFADAADANNLYGDAGNDRVFFGAYDGFGDFGPNDDGIARRMTTEDVNIDLRGKGIEHVYTGTGADSVRGSDNTTQFIPETGNVFNEWIDTSGRDTFGNQPTDDKDDFVDGGAGADHIMTGYGNDFVIGGTGTDAIYTGAGNDVLVTHSNLTANGDSVSNIAVDAGAGDDNIFASAADSAVIEGGAGNDRLFFGAFDGFGDFGPNDDGVARRMTTEDVNIDLRGKEIEHVYTGTGADTVYGSDNTTQFIPETGNTFNEWIDTSGRDTFGNEPTTDKADFVDGGAGADHISTGYGDDFVIGGTGSDAIYSGAGNDVVVTHDNTTANGDSVANYAVDTGAGDDYIFASAADSAVIQGGEGEDRLFFGTFDGFGDFSDSDDGVARRMTSEDVLVNGMIAMGVEHVYTGTGNDTIIVGEGDVGPLSGAPGSDLWIDTSGRDTLGNEPITDGDDHVYGSANREHIRTGAGNDYIDAGEGEDVVYAGLGDDMIITGSTSETITFELPGGDDRGDLGGWDRPAAQARAGGVGGVGGSQTVWHSDGVVDVVEGGAGNDRLFVGAEDAQTISGGEGMDWVFFGQFLGFGGSDGILRAMFADDVTFTNTDFEHIYTGSGNDYIVGSNYAGDENLIDWAGPNVYHEWIDTGAGNDTIVAGAGQDHVLAGDGIDHVDGGAGADTLYGGAGNDVLITGFGDNVADFLADGGAGDDLVIAGAEDVGRVYGGAGSSDQLWFANNIAGTFFDANGYLMPDLPSMTSEDVNVDLTGTGFELVVTGSGQDTVTLGDQNQWAFQDAFGDRFSYVAITNEGSDAVYGSAYNDLIQLGSGADVAYAGAGDDAIISGNAGAGDGQIANDGTVYDGAADFIDAGAGSDQLYISHEDGNSIFGGEGDDFVFFVDAVKGWNAGSPFAVYDSTHSDVTFDAEGKSVEWIKTGLGDDTVYGSDQSSDYVFEDTFNDWYPQYGGARFHEVIDTDAGDDYVDGRGGNDLMFLGDGHDTAFGGAGNDVIYGGEGHDTIHGGAGNDFLYGEGGDDTFVFALDDYTGAGITSTDTIGDFAGGDRLQVSDLVDNGFVNFSFEQVTTGEYAGSVLVQASDGHGTTHDLAFLQNVDLAEHGLTVYQDGDEHFIGFI